MNKSSMKTNRFFTVILSVALCINLVSCDNDDERVESNTTDYVSDKLPIETGIFYFDEVYIYTNYGKEHWGASRPQGKVSVLEEGEDINVIFDFGDGDSDPYRKGVRNGYDIEWYGHYGYAPNYRDIQFLFYFASTTNGKKVFIRDYYGGQGIKKEFYYLK